MSENAKLYAALVKAQGEFKNPGFDKTNPHFKSKFASFAAVREAVLPILNKYGIALLQSPATDEKGIGITTVIVHESGESMTLGPFFMPAAKQDPQGFGSAMTYARRYALMAVAGVVGDDDDDGNAASDKPATRPVSQAPAKTATKQTPQERFGVAIRAWSGIGGGADLLQAASAVAETLAFDLKKLKPDSPEWTTAAEFCEKKNAAGVDFMEWSKPGTEDSK